jgi:alanyl-tRNA synthetase
MTSTEIRQSFLDFFREKQHTIVPSSPLLPDAPNLLFTNAGMNQFVPIFLGQQKPLWKPPRVVDTQKCIRTGGKHNDLEDVGVDTYHHTFFEMLGNWSFGDYFKKEAIEWAWELLVERWKFPPQRLYATVYKPGPGEPSDFDQEAYDHWVHLFREADLDPKIHVLNSGKADNFWMMGDTGPCGPCSEVHMDLTPDGDTRGALVNKGDPRCIEIWNLVFIQFNANADGSFAPLPQRHVDTGMGFERVTAIIQGTRNFTDFSRTISNYETDIFHPLFNEIAKLSSRDYHHTIPTKRFGGHFVPKTDEERQDVAFRVIADHIRALSFAIADGIIPSNESRGYVLRSVLRRAVRYGRTLGFHGPFFFKLVDTLAKTMGDVFPEIRSKQKTIRDKIRREEESFDKTLDQGLLAFETMVGWIPKARAAHAVARSLLKSFQKAWPGGVVSGDTYRSLLKFVSPIVELAEPIGRVRLIPLGVKASIERLADMSSSDQREAIVPQQRVKLDALRISLEEFDRFLGQLLAAKHKVSGEDAFVLYDTYGFPLDLTELMARELALEVDVAGFQELMDQQRERARKARKTETIRAEDTALGSYPKTEFVGYTNDVSPAKIVATRHESAGDFIVVDRSPLYAEMGGQVGDKGKFQLANQSAAIVNTVSRDGVFFLKLAPGTSAADLPTDQLGQLEVDVPRRRAIERHHTVTHLLHWALHEVVSSDASQKGSSVGPDKLTFDFSSAPLTPEQKRAVEKLVNEKIAENAPVSWTEIPFAEAKQRKDIIQFFGEKYGDTVRVLQIGGAPRALNGYSMELCGGTHVRSAGEIGPFRIVREEAIAAGTRRIEAVAGDAARVWAKEEAARQQAKFETFARKKPDIAQLPSFQDDAATAEMLQQIDVRAAHLEKVDGEVREWEKKTAKSAEAELKSSAAYIASELARSHGEKNFCVAEVRDADGKLLQGVVDALKSKFMGPIFLVGTRDASVGLVAYVPPALTAKFQANKLIQQVAPIVGGKGGGRPESAQGAGKDASKINEALAKARELLS